PKSLLARMILHYIRNWDTRTANAVDGFVANSAFIARRIRKVYHRDAAVIFPPVDVDAFSHCAFYDRGRQRIEMHLVSDVAQTVHVRGHAFRFEAGERIHTENSHKFTIDGFHAMARRAGFEPDTVWTDADHLF
ncbi:L-histidine N(alpha)-methyltransferase, partial [Bacillus subtilis]|nr:L-histidine N(alpha)-methyltransferase [Bacillus subtilis]